MPDICLGFEVHQPFRINGEFRPENADGRDLPELFDLYFDNGLNREILERVARKCYLPANQIVLDNIEAHRNQQKAFKVVYSLSGVLVEQLKRWAPRALESFRQLANTGYVEFLDQTYYHSLASLFSGSKDEFADQVKLHRDLMQDSLGCRPSVFENTEFIYNDDIAKTLAGLGFTGIFTEGRPSLLGWRSPNHVYWAGDSGMPVLLRNYRLSDDIAFRFSARDWPGWPLTADKYAAWLSATPGQCIVIFIDYETFGEHHWPETGILEFLKHLPGEILQRGNLHFKTASEVIACHAPVGELRVHSFGTVSWADVEGSTYAWLGNDMQRTCHHALRRMESYVKACGDPEIARLWRLLQTSDHLYYMYTKWGASGLVHGYFSSQPPVKAFWAFMRILSDLQQRAALLLPSDIRPAALALRSLSPDEAFHFYDRQGYTGLSAHSLDEFADVLRLVPQSSLIHHAESGDYAKWVEGILHDRQLARDIAAAGAMEEWRLRERLIGAVARRIEELRSVEPPLPRS